MNGRLLAVQKILKNNTKPPIRQLFICANLRLLHLTGFENKNIFKIHTAPVEGEICVSNGFMFGEPRVAEKRVLKVAVSRSLE